MPLSGGTKGALPQKGSSIALHQLAECNNFLTLLVGPKQYCNPWARLAAILLCFAIMFVAIMFVGCHFP